MGSVTRPSFVEAKCVQSYACVQRGGRKRASGDGVWAVRASSATKRRPTKTEGGSVAPQRTRMATETLLRTLPHEQAAAPVASRIAAKHTEK